MIDLKIQVIDPRAVIPTYGSEDAACFDISVIPKVTIDLKNPATPLLLHTGLKFEVPKGYQLLLFNRSSSAKYGASLANAVGILDADYRGELFCSLANTLNASPQSYLNSLRIANLCYDQPSVYVSGYSVLPPPNASIFGSSVGPHELIRTISSYIDNCEDNKLTIDLNEIDPTLVPARMFQAQLIPVYKSNISVVESLSDTSRGEGGFGSTGK